MAQFVLDTSQLDVDVLGPITFATANATLGSLSATATARIDNIVSASAPLGGLLAQATIPQPESAVVGSFGMPNFVQPNFVLPRPEPKIPSVILAGASASLGVVRINAVSQIDFSVLNDDAEVLLLI
jgi:hypothetical protein